MEGLTTSCTESNVGFESGGELAGKLGEGLLVDLKCSLEDIVSRVAQGVEAVDKCVAWHGLLLG